MWKFSHREKSENGATGKNRRKIKISVIKLEKSIHIGNSLLKYFDKKASQSVEKCDTIIKSDNANRSVFLVLQKKGYIKLK